MSTTPINVTRYVTQTSKHPTARENPSSDANRGQTATVMRYATKPLPQPNLEYIKTYSSDVDRSHHRRAICNTNQQTPNSAFHQGKTARAMSTAVKRRRSCDMRQIPSQPILSPGLRICKNTPSDINRRQTTTVMRYATKLTN